MKSRFESAYRSQIQWQEIEEERAVRLCRQRHHLALLILPRVVVDPLQVGGFSAQTWTVVHELAVDFASRKIDKGHSCPDRPAFFYNIGSKAGQCSNRCFYSVASNAQNRLLNLSI